MYETILVPTDGSAGARAAVDAAVDLADRYGATIHALYVADVRMSPVSSDMDRETVLELLEDDGGKPTTAVLERAADAGVPAVEAIEVGVPHEVIQRYVAEEGVDIVVMGTHGRTGLAHTLLGSLTERTVRTAGVPVLAVPMDDDGDESGDEVHDPAEDGDDRAESDDGDDRAESDE